MLAAMLLLPCVAQEWKHWGGDEGGTRFSRLKQINRSNVSKLKVAWTYHTGDMDAMFTMHPRFRANSGRASVEKRITLVRFTLMTCSKISSWNSSSLRMMPAALTRMSNFCVLPSSP